ncbi:hypothetical protein [Aliisedimentitalea scapharcae]|uniref:hypothetical protein n=1 Tax=Aliisedimentitalea scapharcae TaxID=1524259 RepID=UPI003872CEC6
MSDPASENAARPLDFVGFDVTVEDITVCADRPPQRMLHARDRDQDCNQLPLVVWPWTILARGRPVLTGA